jgi:hypothetical protein
MTSAGSMTLPMDFDILRPSSSVTKPSVGNEKEQRASTKGG